MGRPGQLSEGVAGLANCRKHEEAPQEKRLTVMARGRLAQVDDDTDITEVTDVTKITNATDITEITDVTEITR